MPKQPDHKTPRKNRTEERLRATPFTSVADLDHESRSIRLAVWRKFAEAKVVHELLTKPENSFVLDEWRAGLTALYVDIEPKEQIFRISSDGHGLRLELNRSFARGLADGDASLYEGLIRAGIEGYGSLYLRTKSVLRDPEAPVSELPPLKELVGADTSET
jgi:hypothetical protein